MARFETWLHSDLQRIPEVTPLTGNLFSADIQSNRVGVIVTDGGKAVVLNGGVTGYVIRADGKTVWVTGGVISGNKAYIDLPASCYTEVGPIQIVIKNGNTTLGACKGFVYRTSTDTLIDPGKEVPTLTELLEELGNLRSATAAATSATSGANTAAANANQMALEASRVNVEMTKNNKIITIKTTNRNNVTTTKTTQEPTLIVSKSGNVVTLKATDADGVTTTTFTDAPINDNATATNSFWSSSKVNTELEKKLNSTLKGAKNGLAELDSEGKVPASQLPSFVDDVLEYDSRNDFPTNGEAGKIYVAKDTNLTYRWTGSTYVEISQSLALGETSSTACRGDRGKVAYDHASAKGSAFASGLYKITTNAEGHVIGAVKATKEDIGLGNVDNTADKDKPSSQAMRQAEEAAAQSATDAAESERNAEAWAVGTRGGTAVLRPDETYQNSSKYHAQQAEAAKNAILGMQVVATTLAPGSDATVQYQNGKMTFGIPAGQSESEYFDESIAELKGRPAFNISISEDGETLIIEDAKEDSHE